MTVMEVAESPTVTPHEAKEWVLPCECWHGPPEREGLSGHEFSRYAGFVRDGKAHGFRRVPCTQQATWRGLYSCDQNHLHSVVICTDCKLLHDADALHGGTALGWDKIDG